MIDINEYLSWVGNYLPSISDLFDWGSNTGDVSEVSATGNDTSIGDSLSSIGDSLKSFVTGIGDSLGGLLGGLLGGTLSPVTGEINTVLLYLLLAIVAIVFIVAYYGENIGHFFKGVFVA
jgi:high-affinity Fe2+/Pb2+ permease